MPTGSCLFGHYGLLLSRDFLSMLGAITEPQRWEWRQKVMVCEIYRRHGLEVGREGGREGWREGYSLCSIAELGVILRRGPGGIESGESLQAAYLVF